MIIYTCLTAKFSQHIFFSTESKKDCALPAAQHIGRYVMWNGSNGDSGHSALHGIIL